MGIFSKNLIKGLLEKLAPVAADIVVIEDSEDNNKQKKVQVGNLPTETFFALVLSTASESPTFAQIKSKLVLGDTDAAGGTQTITLPSGTATDDGKVFIVQRLGSNLLTIAVPATYSIKISGGSAPLDLPDDGDSVMFVYRHATKTYHAV